MQQRGFMARLLAGEPGASARHSKWVDGHARGHVGRVRRPFVRGGCYAALVSSDAPSAAMIDAVSSRPGAPRFFGAGYALAFGAVTFAGFLQAYGASSALVPRERLLPLGLTCALYALLGTLAPYA